MIFFLSISAYIHLQIRREECSVFYSMVAFVLVHGLVGLLCTHAQHMLSSILLSFPLLFPFSLILQLQVHSPFPASCLSVFAPRTYTIVRLFESLALGKSDLEPGPSALGTVAW